MARNIRVGITHGDYNGVGYEVMLKALADDQIPEIFTPVLFADMRLIERAAKELQIQLPPMAAVASAAEARDGRINVVDLRLPDIKVEPGQPDAASGAAAVKALEEAVAAVKEGDIDVIVTAPISKEAVQSDAFHFPGHTEYLADRAGDGFKAQMILFEDSLRVALVTTHLPISEIPQAITRERVADTVRRFDAVLRQDFGIERPRIAVLGLNPHCGDGGVIGSEEKEQIIPAINDLADEGIMAFGPFSSDAFFASDRGYRNFDGVVAMYHDQGLAPFKTIARTGGVNFTAGLPFVRTSPDHGTACDIAWKGIADPQSMREAIYRAIDIFRTRRRHLQAARNPLRKAPKPDRADKRKDDHKDELKEANKEPRKEDRPEQQPKTNDQQS